MRRQAAPHRRRWRRIAPAVLIALLAVPLLLGAWWTYWDVRSRREMNDAEAMLRERGVPRSVADLQPLRQAAASARRTPGWEQLQGAAALVDAEAPAWRMLREHPRAADFAAWYDPGEEAVEALDRPWYLAPDDDREREADDEAHADDTSGVAEHAAREAQASRDSADAPAPAGLVLPQLTSGVLDEAGWWLLAEATLREQRAAVEAAVEAALAAMHHDPADAADSDDGTTRPQRDSPAQHLQPSQPHAPLPPPDAAGLQPHRDLARLLALAARRHAAARRHDLVAPAVVAMLSQARVLGQDAHLLAEAVLAIGVDAHAADTVLDIAPHLVIGNAPGAMSPAEAHRLVELLLDERPLVAELRRGLEAEAVMQRQFIDAFLAGGEDTGDVEIDGILERTRRITRLVRPLVRNNAAMLHRHMAGAFDALEAGDWPAAEAHLPEPAGDLRALRNILAAILIPPVERAIEGHHRRVTERRMAAVALAVAIYRADHDGALPPDLESLVPDYLPHVPRDAMAAGEAPLRYDRERGIIWSVGADGIDNGGDTSPRPGPAGRTIPAQPPTPWLKKDHVRPLTREAAVTLRYE